MSTFNGSQNVNSQSATSQAGLCVGGRETRGGAGAREAGKEEREHGWRKSRGGEESMHRPGTVF